MKNKVKILSTIALLASTAPASATVIGMFTDGSVGSAQINMNIVVSGGLLTPGDGADSWVALNGTVFNSMTTAQLLAAYDTIVMPWNVAGIGNFDWNTIILPYLNAGGSILWEDPNNIAELAASGIGLTTGNNYGSVGESDISLVAPFGDDGASGYYHIHYSITSATSDWSVWSTDVNGRIHGVYREFNNGGRMVLGVSDNLYHPNFGIAEQADHYQLTTNQLNWLNTGSITGIPTPPSTSVSEPTSIALLGLALSGIAFSRRKSKLTKK